MLYRGRRRWQRQRMNTLCHFSITILLAGEVSGWTTLPHLHSRPVAFRRHALHQKPPSEIVDVEFERVDENPSQDAGQLPDATNNDAKEDDESSKTLLDLSLDSDPDWKEAKVPFVSGENYIDVKLAFMADLDGVSYGIGIPFEPAAALALEQPGGSVTYLSPDDNANEELMEIMATQLQEHVGEDLQLKRTPRVLTIEGPLDKYTKNWKENILPDPVDARTLMEDEDDENYDFFHKFMKEELGEEEYEKTLKEENSNDVSDELLALFEIPGIGTKEDDVEGVEELLKSMLDEPDEQLKALDELGPNVNHEGVGLKLVSYIFPGGKAYSLVQLVKPYILVGKYIEAGDDTHFELLLPDEAQLVIPRLEAVCEDDFKKSGLSSTSV